MSNAKVVEDFSRKLSILLSSPPLSEIEKSRKAALGDFLSDLNMVSRKDFDTQTQMLSDVRQKLTSLEARLVALETTLFSQTKS